ncbi:MAG: sn-glycerol-3-phosphate ABC transporter ATP-binding protein UgpC [Anaeroplasmataceae bacterium]|nr:sn-glycerol-3-phosphate ABC transporter ATP-binding protein UgpC [Anaeroplasmataceae bacterium]
MENNELLVSEPVYDVILKDVNKVYPNGFHAVYDFNMNIKKGDFIVLAGPSGCGKSTTLRMIAGLEEISSGDLIINGKRVNDVAPKDRDIAMVFQNYALYAHMTVYQNLAFSLTIRKTDPQIIHKQVMYAANVLGLVPYLNRKPKALSGGQRQRVAVGRAIVRDPVVFLLDEPLSNLDAKLRGSMRKELMQLHDRLGATFIYVTHDQIEALTLATRIVVMKDGYVQQIATPKEMFEYPENLFVAGFIGTPPCNFYNGTIDDQVTKFIHKSGAEIYLSKEQSAILKDYASKEVVMASRPDYVFVDEKSMKKYNKQAFDLNIDYFEFLGAYKLVYGTFGDERIIAKVDPRDEINGNTIKACFQSEKILFFDKDTEKRIR